MLQIHPNARTTPVTCAEIARSGEPSGLLAQRGVVQNQPFLGYKAPGSGWSIRAVFWFESLSLAGGG